MIENEGIFFIVRGSVLFEQTSYIYIHILNLEKK